MSSLEEMRKIKRSYVGCPILNCAFWLIKNFTKTENIYHLRIPKQLSKKSDLHISIGANSKGTLQYGTPCTIIVILVHFSYDFSFNSHVKSDPSKFDFSSSFFLK